MGFKKTLILASCVLATPKGYCVDFSTLTPELLKKGKEVYTKNCIVCHGEQGDGNGAAGQYMNPKPRHFSKDKFKNGNKPQNIFDTTTQGLPGTTMIGFSQLSEQERWAVTHYITSEFTPKIVK